MPADVDPIPDDTNPETAPEKPLNCVIRGGTVIECGPDYERKMEEERKRAEAAE